MFRNVKNKIYKIIIVPVVLHGCRTWPLTLRREHRLRMFENRSQGEWLHQTRGSNSRLENIAQRESSSFSWSSITIIKFKIWVGYVARLENKSIKSFERKD
jgi:hypothetical protein